MINADKVTKFDLTQFINNFDPAQIPQMVMDQKKPIMLVFAVVTLIIAAGMYQDHRIKEQALKTKMSQEQAKLGVIDGRNAAVKALDDYKATLPKMINEVELITKISNFANQFNVTIATFKPADMADMGLYDVIDMGFTAESNSFKDLMFFLRKIERSNMSLRINTWSESLGNGGKISVDVKLSAVHIHS